MTHLRPLLRLFLPVLALLAAAPEAKAQANPPRYGLGLELMLNPFADNPLGIGVRGRVSFPYNADVSFAGDLGVIGSVFNGRQDATFLFNPQGTVIVTLPGSERQAPYAMAGVGAVLTAGGDMEGGPTIHLGVGLIRALSESTAFVEVNPNLVIARENSYVILPVRVGLIF